MCRSGNDRDRWGNIVQDAGVSLGWGGDGTGYFQGCRGFGEGYGVM